jgi:hypothetical protein
MSQNMAFSPENDETILCARKSLLLERDFEAKPDARFLFFPEFHGFTDRMFTKTKIDLLEKQNRDSVPRLCQPCSADSRLCQPWHTNS